MGFLHLHPFLLLLCLLPLATEGRITSLKQKWVSLVPDQEGAHEHTVLWPDNNYNTVVGIALTDEEVWTFAFTKNELKERQKTIPDEPTLYYQESKAFHEEFSKPLFENDEWDRHVGEFRAAIILSSDHRGGDAPFRGLVGALAEEMKKKTKVDKVGWKEVTTSRPAQLLLRTMKNGNIHRFSISRGSHNTASNAVFTGSITPQGGWESGDLPTPDWGKEEPVNSLMVVQRLCDVETTSSRSALPRDPSNWEPTAQLIQFKWPTGSHMPQRALYCNDDSINPNDMVIMVVTTESAWILMLPKQFIDDANLQTTEKQSWYREIIGDKVQDMWEKVIRRCDDDHVDGNDQTLIHGKLTGIVFLSRGFQSRSSSNLRNELLFKRILSDMWRVSDDPDQRVKGPLRGRDPIQIPFFNFEADTRLPPDTGESYFAERVLAPEHYLAIETKSQYNLPGTGTRGKQGSLFHLFYGRQVVFSGAFAQQWEGDELVQNEDYYLSSPKGDGLHSTEFHPPPPWTVSD